MSTNLIVNYLPQEVSDNELYCMFITIGEIVSCRVMKDLKSGYSYGFGFVNYNRPEDAENAVKTLNGLKIGKKRIKVSYARPSEVDTEDANLYVTNIPRNFTENDLDALFGRYGTIVNSKLLRDKVTSAQRGAGFVRFSCKQEAHEAIKSLDGQIPDGYSEKICVRVADNYGKQKAAYFKGLKDGLQRNKICAPRGVFQGRGGFNSNIGLHTGGSFMNSGYNSNNQTHNGFDAHANIPVIYPTRQRKYQHRCNPLSYKGH